MALHVMRNNGRVTWRTIIKALGYDGLKRQKEHFEKVACSVEEKEPAPENQANIFINKGGA